MLYSERRDKRQREKKKIQEEFVCSVRYVGMSVGATQLQTLWEDSSDAQFY